MSGRQRGRGQASAARAGLPAVGVGTVAEGPRDLSGRQKLPTSEALESRASLGPLRVLSTAGPAAACRLRAPLFWGPAGF